MAKVKDIVYLKPFCVSEPVFGTSITFCIGMSYETMLKKCDNGDIIFPPGYGYDGIKEHSSSGGVALMCDAKDGMAKYRILWVAKLNDLPVLVHELTHSIQFLCKFKGISTHADEPEPFAYLMEFYFKEAYKHLKNKGAI